MGAQLGSRGVSEGSSPPFVPPAPPPPSKAPAKAEGHCVCLNLLTGCSFPSLAINKTTHRKTKGMWNIMKPFFKSPLDPFLPWLLHPVWGQGHIPAPAPGGCRSPWASESQAGHQGA